MVKVASVSPFTLAMFEKLFENQDEECLELPDGRLIGTVKLVGQIENLEDREGFRAILFDDTTGYRVIRDYKEPEDQAKLSKGDFVRVYGSCKIAKGGKGIYFNAFEIMKMEDKGQADHVSAHLIEVVVAHLRKKNGASVANGPSAAMSMQQASSKPVAAVQMNNFADSSIPGASADQQKVLAVVKNNDTEEGANLASDFDHLGMGKDKLQEILNWLSDEGHIYSTVDDDHFKTT